MAVYVLYQGQQFEVAPGLGDRYEVQEHIQQRLMTIRFTEAAWVEGEADTLPSAWLPLSEEGTRARSEPGAAAAMSSSYTVYPDNAGQAVVYRPFINITLADGRSLDILVHDNLEIAVLSGPES